MKLAVSAVLLAVSAVAFVPLAPTRLTSVLREAVDPEPEMIDPAWRQRSR